MEISSFDAGDAFVIDESQGQWNPARFVTVFPAGYPSPRSSVPSAYPHHLTCKVADRGPPPSGSTTHTGWVVNDKTTTVSGFMECRNHKTGALEYWNIIGWAKNQNHPISIDSSKSLAINIRSDLIFGPKNNLCETPELISETVFSLTMEPIE